MRRRAPKVDDIDDATNDAETQQIGLDHGGDNPPLGEKFGENFGDGGGENFPPPSPPGSVANSSGWALAGDIVGTYRIMRYKQRRYFKSRSKDSYGKQHDRHICAVAPVYTTRNSHRAASTRAAYARQRKAATRRAPKR